MKRRPVLELIGRYKVCPVQTLSDAGYLTEAFDLAEEHLAERVKSNDRSWYRLTEIGHERLESMRHRGRPAKDGSRATISWPYPSES